MKNFLLGAIMVLFSINTMSAGCNYSRTNSAGDYISVVVTEDAVTSWNVTQNSMRSRSITNLEAARICARHAGIAMIGDYNPYWENEIVPISQETIDALELNAQIANGTLESLYYGGYYGGACTFSSGAGMRNPVTYTVSYNTEGGMVGVTDGSSFSYYRVSTSEAKAMCARANK